jgi:hypothetical protein
MASSLPSPLTKKKKKTGELSKFLNLSLNFFSFYNIPLKQFFTPLKKSLFSFVLPPHEKKEMRIGGTEIVH